jgi:hypothetical protein
MRAVMRQPCRVVPHELQFRQHKKLPTESTDDERRWYAMGKNQHVVPADSGWGVRGEGNSRLTTVVPTQAEAIQVSREICENQKSE